MALREGQRLAVAESLHSGMVPSLDLNLRDGIHLATPDLKRIGVRFANLILKKEYGDLKRLGGPVLDSVRLDVSARRIYVRFSGVEGGFLTVERLMGFRLETVDGSEVPTIFRTEVDSRSRDTVVLSYQGPLPDGVRLAFGWGVNPYCNLVDHADMAASAFGPLS